MKNERAQRKEQVSKVTNFCRSRGKGRGKGKGRQFVKNLVKCFSCHKLGQFQCDLQSWRKCKLCRV